MSEATLKKKSRVLYNNLSVRQNGFSLNGGHRSAGYIGQSTQSRHLTRTLAKGNVLRGNGGCCGTYLISNVYPSELACLNNPNVIKPSVLNTNGLLHTKYKWFWSGRQTVKPDSNEHYIQSDYISNISRNTVSCADNSFEVPTDSKINCNSLPTLARPRTTGLIYGTIRHRPVCPITKPDTYNVAIPQSQYLQQLNANCTENDKNTINQISNYPIPGLPRSIGSVS